MCKTKISIFHVHFLSAFFTDHLLHQPIRTYLLNVKTREKVYTSTRAQTVLFYRKSHMQLANAIQVFLLFTSVQYIF